jgi:superfamily II DNA or RNA helicase
MVRVSTPSLASLYQVDVIEECRQDIKANHKKIILVAPTGSGKTIIAGSIIKSAVAKASPARPFPP